MREKKFSQDNGMKFKKNRLKANGKGIEKSVQTFCFYCFSWYSEGFGGNEAKFADFPRSETRKTGGYPKISGSPFFVAAGQGILYKIRAEEQVSEKNLGEFSEKATG